MFPGTRNWDVESIANVRWTYLCTLVFWGWISVFFLEITHHTPARRSCYRSPCLGRSDGSDRCTWSSCIGTRPDGNLAGEYQIWSMHGRSETGFFWYQVIYFCNETNCDCRVKSESHISEILENCQQHDTLTGTLSLGILSSVIRQRIIAF